ncbi:T9SS type A sorting domain-containing protein [Winogradskyella litorisediminis]|uniref:T9SS type A sorting domain-containing protein n=1 Tax=Winogradskyella litorisediminis TaxID=1156618 RepID=A0ABW3N7J5_9FLAO
MKQFYLLLLASFAFTKMASQPANDDCANSQNITVELTSNTYNFDINSAVISNQEGCSGTTNDYADVWFDFTMPVNGNLFVDAGINWNVIVLYDACNGTELRCSAGNELFTDLTSGTNYKLRIFRSSATAPNTSFQSFSIIAFEQVTNDTCATAETITVSETEADQTFNIGGADINNEVGCSSSAAEDYSDIWYKFTMPIDGKLNIDGDISWNNFALYSSCSGTELDCGSNEILFENLTQGTEYFLRVFRTRANTDNNGFRSFSTRVFSKPINDDCSNAINLSVSATQIDVDFEIGGADLINEIGCDGTTAENLVDIWYEFNMPFDGNIAIDSGILWNRFALYDSCTGTQLGCDITDALFTNLTQNTNYKLRVFRTEGTSTNLSFRSFKITAFQNVNNDNCSTATPITVSEMDNTINFDIGGASLNNEIGCNGSAAEEYVDIWYDFNLAESGNISISSPINWNNFALYDACSGTEIGCVNTNGIFENLNSTTSYKLRVFRTKVFADDGFRQFTIKQETTLGNTEFNPNSQINLYPNPANEYVDISNTNTEILKIELFDISGKRIYSGSENKIDVRNLKNGIYLLTIKTDFSITTKKIIVKHL